MPELIGQARRIAHEATEFRKLGEVGDCGQAARCDEVRHALKLNEEDRVSDEEDAVDFFPNDRVESAVKLGECAHLQWLNGERQRSGSGFDGVAPKATEVLHCRELMAVPSVADCQASPVGTIVAVSIIRMTAFSGARVRWITPFGTTKPCCGESATERPSRSMMNVPLSTKKNSSSLSCLCQWYSPCMTPRRTTESFTLQSV